MMYANRVRRTVLTGTRSAAFGTGLVTTLGVHALHSYFAPKDQRDALLDAYRRRFSRETLRVFGVRHHVTPTPTPAHSARLVVANHRSLLDIGILLAHFGGDLVSRADVATWPLLGLAARRTRTIFVDRGNRSSGARAIRAMRARLKEGGTLIVFPEGRTFRGDDVRPFQHGAFAAAAGQAVEVVPVGFAYEPGTEYVDTPFVEHLGQIASRPETLAVARVGEPFVIDGDRRAAVARAHAAVSRLVQEARAEHSALTSG